MHMLAIVRKDREVACLTYNGIIPQNTAMTAVKDTGPKTAMHPDGDVLLMHGKWWKYTNDDKYEYEKHFRDYSNPLARALAA